MWEPRIQVPSGPEATIRNMQRVLLRDLPAALEWVMAKSQSVYLADDSINGGQTWKLITEALKKPAEIWNAPRIKLNFPAIEFIDLRSDFVDVDDEGITLQAQTHSLQIRLTLTHHDGQQLTFMWDRYVVAIRSVLANASIEDRIIGIPDVVLPEPFWLVLAEVPGGFGTTAENASLFVREGVLEVTAAH